MNKSWIIWSLVLIFTGIIGLGGIIFDKYRFEKIIAPYYEEYSKDEEEFISIYNQWSNLSADEKLVSPWGQGKYGGQEMMDRLKENQEIRLMANLPDLASGVKEPHALSDILYGSKWYDKVSDYKKKKEIKDILAIVSSVTIVIGFLLMIGSIARIFIYRNKENDNYKQTSDQKKTGKTPGNKLLDPIDDPYDQFVKTTSSTSDSSDKRKPPEKPGYFEQASTEKPTQKKPVKTEGTNSFVNSANISIGHYKDQFQPAGGFDNVATLMSTTPVVTDSLSELTQEMSAIREFAAQQQDRVKQLQDGYDWSIIKRFCIRIIRCIDNLDTRIQKIAQQGEETMSLEDIRDELLFALESSGVEQFEPEVDTNYKGLEKKVEAVRARVKSDKASMKGKIAEIVRPGYHYVVNDDELKIVRCAQVKLYG